MEITEIRTIERGGAPPGAAAAGARRPVDPTPPQPRLRTAAPRATVSAASPTSSSSVSAGHPTQPPPSMEIEEVPPLQPGGAPPGAAGTRHPANPTPPQLRFRTAAQQSAASYLGTQTPGSTVTQEVAARAGVAPRAPVAAATSMPSASAPAQIRVQTLPLKAAAWAAGEQERPSALQSQVAFPKDERWDRTVSIRLENSFSVQFDKLAPALSMIGSGLAKVLEGFGLKTVDPEVKERQEKEKKEREDKEKQEREEKEKQDREIAAANGLILEYLAKKNKEEAEKQKEAERQKRLAVILAIPNCIINGSKVLDGVRDVITGGKETALVLGHLAGVLPSVMRRSGNNHVSACGATSGAVPSMGSGSCGLRMLLNRHILTRSSGGSVLVCDGFGPRKDRVPGNLCGTRVISSKAELYQAITDFKLGRLTQRLDIDVKRISLQAAGEMWDTLCSEQLTGLLVSDCALLTMSLQAGALVEERKVVKDQLEAAETVVQELMSSVSSLEMKLGRIPVKGKLE